PRPLRCRGRRRGGSARRVRGVRRADTGRGVRVLPAPPAGRDARVADGARRLAEGRDATDHVPAPPADGGIAVVARPFAAGDRVLLVDAKRRRHLVTLEAGGQYHTHAGYVAHDDVIGCADGSSVRTTRNARFVVLRPTLAEYVLEMPRGAQ